MKRKEFIKGLGIIGLSAAALPAALAKLTTEGDEPSNQELIDADCIMAPSETEGPYPAPSSVSTSTLVRSDITEGSQTGVPLSLTLTLVNVDNSCAPLSGLRVDIWHCNKRGYYSAYNGQPGVDGTQNNAGTTWLRGIQYTDSNGQVTFTTIYPGWYTSRATHIHVQIFNGSTLLATTQLAFPESDNSTVNTFYGLSANPTINTNDNVFSDSYTDEMLTVSGDTSSGYIAERTIGINAGTMGNETYETETGGQFSKLMNYPNPFNASTTISFQLIQASTVSLLVTDIMGRTVYQLPAREYNAGGNSVLLDSDALSLRPGEYFYRLTVTNVTGTFMQTKSMIKQ